MISILEVVNILVKNGKITERSAETKESSVETE